MSQVYLTKIERKTIFTKSLIYVLIMFIVSDLTVTGPFWFNFIPWLFLFGVIGTVKDIDKVLTCLIGTFTVFVSSVIVEGSLTVNSGVCAANALLQLILGIAVGKCIYEFILEHRLVKYIRNSKKAILIGIMVISFVCSIGITAILKGDVYSYITAKNRLNKYIQNIYDTDKYSVEKAEYNIKLKGRYAFVVNFDGQVVYFVPITKTSFQDANMKDRLDNLNANLENNFKTNISDILEDNYTLLTLHNISIQYGYTKVGVVPDEITVMIDCEAESKEMNGLWSELAGFINKMQKVQDNIDKIVINVNNSTMEINTDEVDEITKEYIKGGFEIEDLDE